MDSRRGLMWLENKAARFKNKGADLLKVRESVDPQSESLKIILVYIILGALWVLFSNNIISFFVRDKDTFTKVLTYKGWMYVLITGSIFYMVIKNRMILFKRAVDTIFNSYEELTAAHEELIAMEEELMDQYDQIKAHSEALAISEQRYQTLAYYDTITNLPNRIMFEEETRKIINQLEGTGKKIAVIYLDVDNFKHINDILGHKMGDKFIAHMGSTLSNCVKAPDIVARLGGDEFAITLVDIQNENDVIEKITCMLSYIRQPWTMEGHKFFTTVSMGAALYPEHGTNLSRLMQNADAAMFEVKENGKDGFCIFAPYIKEKTLRHIKLINELRTAINNEEFVLYYQPQIDLTTNKIIGLEALIRWMHPKRGLILPGEFIAFAEDTGYIEEIGQWVFKSACEQKRKWAELGYTHTKVSVNLSGKELTKEGFIDNVRKKVRENRTKCGRCKYMIEIEITETAIMTDLEKAIKVLKQLKDLGFTIALDDFGTGYSSLTYLQKLPIDVLKVDKEFIANIIDKKEDYYIFKAIMELANDLGLTVIAEGIETREQLDFLIENGCKIGQGFYFSRPIPADKIEILLKEGCLGDGENNARQIR